MARYSTTLTPSRGYTCSYRCFSLLAQRIARMEIFSFLVNGKRVGCREYHELTGKCPQCALEKAGATGCVMCHNERTVGILTFKKHEGKKFSMARWKQLNKKGRVPCPKCQRG